MNAAVWLIATLALLWMAAWFGLRRYQHRQLYKPTAVDGPLSPDPASLGLDFDDVVIDGPDGNPVHGWWLPCDPAAGTLLFLHGNRGNLSDRIDSLALYRRLGLNVLGIDYRGYGRSPGTPSEIGLYADAYAAWRYLRDTLQLPARELVILGRSLGGGVASALATRTRAGAVVIESTFTSIPDLAREAYPHLPQVGLSNMTFDNLARIPTIRSPLLLVHSRDDQVIGYHHGLALAKAAGQTVQLVTTTGAHSGGHLTSGDAYRAPLREFLLAANIQLVDEGDVQRSV